MTEVTTPELADPAAAPAEPPGRVLVVGGGISGLAAALELVRRSPTVRVTILEAGDRLGGKIITLREDGFVIEGGPDVFIGSKPGALELCRELGLADRLHGTASGIKGSYVLSGGRLHRLPEGLTGLVPSRAAPFVRSRIVSWRGKLRMAIEYVLPPRQGDADESVESFVVRRLGREMYDRMVEPLLSGIYAGDGARLSLRATFPQLRESERRHGGLVRAMLAARKSRRDVARTGPAPAGFLSLPTGLQEMIDALAARLAATGRVEIRLRAPALALDRAGRGWAVRVGDDEVLDADAVVIATPVRAAASLLEPLDTDAAAALREIPLVSSTIVALGYRVADVPRALDATGYVVPRADGREVLACTWSSSKFTGRAPEGEALFRLFFGGATRPDVSALADDEIVRRARAELREVLGVTAEPTLVRLFRWTDALPQPVLGHQERVARIERAIERQPGLALAGNAYHGIGIPDCIRSGQRAAERLMAGVHG